MGEGAEISPGNEVNQAAKFKEFRREVYPDFLCDTGISQSKTVGEPLVEDEILKRL